MTNLLLQVLILNSITAACWKNNREGILLSTLMEAAGAGTLGYTHLIHFGRCQGISYPSVPQADKENQEQSHKSLSYSCRTDLDKARAKPTGYVLPNPTGYVLLNPTVFPNLLCTL